MKNQKQHNCSFNNIFVYIGCLLTLFKFILCWLCLLIWCLCVDPQKKRTSLKLYASLRYDVMNEIYQRGVQNDETELPGISCVLYYITIYKLSLSHTIALYPTPEKSLVISKRKLSPIIGQLIIMVVGFPGQFIISCTLAGTA